MPRGVRVAAWMVLLVTLSALSAQHIGAAPTWAPQGSGGIAGQALANGLTTVLGAFGGSLLLLTLAIVASPLALTFSWPDILSHLCHWVFAVAASGNQRAARPGTASGPGDRQARE